MEQFIPELAKLGFQGVVMGALAWALWQRVKRIDQIQDERIKDFREFLNGTNAVLDKLAERIERLSGGSK